MSEQEKVTPEQARLLSSAKSKPAAKANAPTIVEARTRGEDIPDGGTLDVATVILSGTAEPDHFVEVFDTSGRPHHTVANASSQWSVMAPSLARGEHIFTAVTMHVGEGAKHSNPWKIIVEVGERIKIDGLYSVISGVMHLCGTLYPVDSSEPVGRVGIALTGEVGTSFQVANSGESPEPPPPGSLLWGPVHTLRRSFAMVEDNRLGSPPVQNWYHIRTADSGPLVVDKCLGNFVRVVNP